MQTNVWLIFLGNNCFEQLSKAASDFFFLYRFSSLLVKGRPLGQERVKRDFIALCHSSRHVTNEFRSQSKRSSFNLEYGGRKLFLLLAYSEVDQLFEQSFSFLTRVMSTQCKRYSVAQYSSSQIDFHFGEAPCCQVSVWVAGKILVPGLNNKVLSYRFHIRHFPFHISLLSIPVSELQRQFLAVLKCCALKKK